MATERDKEKNKKRTLARSESSIKSSGQNPDTTDSYPHTSPQDTRPEISATHGAQSPIIESEPGSSENHPLASGDSAFPIVGIGASAGGLEAYERFFRNMPAKSGMAFVLIPHLDPSHITHMPELIQRTTTMPVVLVKSRTRVQPNSVYIIPPDWIMGILHGNLHLVRRYESKGGVSTISYFMRTLAEDQGENAICIILSGMGNDGSQAVTVVKEELGFVIAQDPNSAKYPSMPEAAISTGSVDLVLTPEDMPKHLIEHVALSGPGSRSSLSRPSEAVSEDMEKIFIILRSVSGHDFSSYKRNTVLRRIQRRMAAHRLNSLSDYVKLLNESNHEIKRLFEDLLIGVTRFFRDAEAFESLKQRSLIPYLSKLPEDYIIRVWIPGCSGGEEPYSVAMTLRECSEELGREFQFQIFATDIDNVAIDKARVGLYPESIAEDVGQERLNKYFTQEDHAYRVKPEIRHMLVFAPQNVIKDPPLTKLDLLCCRNLLIYFDVDLQKRLMPLFHYSLRPNGILLLGSSETVGSFSEFFSVIDKRWKIYQRRDGVAPNIPQLDFSVAHKIMAKTETSAIKTSTHALTREVERALLSRYAPPAAVVDARGNVVFVHGRTGQFLELSAGAAKMNIVEMAREGLRLSLSSALRKASAAEEEIVVNDIRVKNNGGSVLLTITVSPVSAGQATGLYLVTFQQLPEVVNQTEQTPVVPKRASRYVHDLELEVKKVKEHLQTTIEELETANEELRSINEEYQSTNEELQSSNEELNTSREELQSLNEELETVNAEYQNQMQLLQNECIDLQDLLENLNIPTIVLDSQLRIKRFSSSIARIINVINSDIGRPLADIVHRLTYPALVSDAAATLSTLTPRVIEAMDTGGSWYVITMRPMRGSVGSIGGIVISLQNITGAKQSEEQLSMVNRSLTSQRQLADATLDTIREGLLILDSDFRILYANRRFYDLFRTEPDELINRFFYDLGNHQWDIPELRQLLEEILPRRTVLFDYMVTHSFPNVGTRTIMLNARELFVEDQKQKRILLAFEDITKKPAR